MKNGRRKRKIKVGRVIICIIVLLLIICSIVFLFSKGKNIVINKNTMYLASYDNLVKLYSLDEEYIIKEVTKCI